MLTENTIHHVEYESIGKKDITKRYIIPTVIPKDTIKAIDVSDCDNEARSELTKLLRDYKSYQVGFLKGMFTFEMWAEHVSKTLPDLKWRTFKVNGLKELKFENPL
ncbi:MAG: hypothetical protein ACREAU_00285 [Nitrosopumilaceae archaeon]